MTSCSEGPAGVTSVLGLVSGVSLLLKKEAALTSIPRARYTPLVEVNQALIAWSFRQLQEEFPNMLLKPSFSLTKVLSSCIFSY